MMDSELAQKIGELIAEVRGINHRLDGVLANHDDLEMRVRTLETALAWSRGMARAAVGIASVAVALAAAAIKFAF